jgi:phosphoglycolate phosphatase
MAGMQERSTNDHASLETPRLIIFDLDGTLVDSKEGIARTFNGALERVAGAPPLPPEQVYSMIGLPLSHMFSAALPAAEGPLIAALIAHYREQYDAIEVPRTPPFPGVLATLAACRAAGIALSVATTKGQRVAEAVVDAAGLQPYLALVLGGDSVPNHKPAPDLVLRTLAELGVAADEALVVGDSSYDMLMAANAKVRGVGVTYGTQPAEMLVAAGACHLLDAMPALLPLLGIAVEG